MSFGVGIGDIILLGTLTWKLYKNCKESSAEFNRISSEVASLHVVIKETEEYVSETEGLSPSRDARLTILIDGCKEVLTELESLLNNYESLGTQAQRSWDRVRWGLEELADVRSRIISNTSLLTAFNSSLAKYVSLMIYDGEWANGRCPIVLQRRGSKSDSINSSKKSAPVSARDQLSHPRASRNPLTPRMYGSSYAVSWRM